MKSLIGPLVVSLLWASVTPHVNAQVYAPKERFLTMMADGSRLKTDKLVNWYDQKTNPTVGGRSIFDANNPARWIIDQAVALGPVPESSIEFFGGDTIPARVIDYLPATPNSYENIGECLIVKPTIQIDFPNRPPSEYIRVSTRWLKRIVFDRRANSTATYQPGTVFLRDGSRLSFKVARWGQGAISFLTSNGIQSLLLAQIAELHFPAQDAWEVWFEQLAMLSPQLDQRFLQIETSKRVRLTCTRQRLRPMYYGDRNKSENWYPEFQPAWSLDPLVLPFRTIRSWRFFSATDVPTTLFEPTARRDGVVFSTGWNWKLNGNVQQASLINNALHFGWGFGVHAPTALKFPLHPVVSHFRTRIGLDQIVATGGCARGVVSIEGKSPREVQRTGVLIGNQTLHDTNWLSVAVPDAEHNLVLFADPVIANRPAKADPFDIRDCVNWLEPEWRLDRAKLQIEVSKRIPQIISGLVGWKLRNQVLPLPSNFDPAKAKPTDDLSQVNSTSKEDASTPFLAATVYRDETIPNDFRTRVAFRPLDRFVVVSRSVKLPKTAKWFAVAVTRVRGSSPAWIQIRANGRALGHSLIPERVTALDPDPALVSVAQLAGSTVNIELIMVAGDDKANIDFRGVQVLEHRPGLVQLFDEDVDFPKLFDEGEGDLIVTDTEHFKGTKSLKLTGGDKFNARIAGYGYRIAETPRLGEYRFIRFCWKKDGGEKIGFQLGYNEEIGAPVVDEDNTKNLAKTPVMAARQRAARQRAMERIRAKGRSPRRLPTDDQRGLQFAYQYDTGNDKSNEPVMRLDRKPPTEWIHVGRDLFGEFGSFDITGLGFRCPDGNAAYFDHIYLGRTQKDFAYLADFNPGPRVEDKNVLAHVREMWLHQSLVQRVAPQFSLEKSGEPVQLLAEFAGRKNVVRTAPAAEGQPGLLRAPLHIPAGKKTTLQVSAGRNVKENADWQLIVKVGSQTLLSSLVDANTAKDGWTQHAIDLSSFAGKNVVLEVHNHPNNWHYEHAYWEKLIVVSQ